MIVVIADDLTGAAEIGGIGLSYGLSVEVNICADLNSKADLLIIATDTRSMPKKQALLKSAELSASLYHIKPKLIFKKVDSVLRGHIVTELNTHLHQLGLSKALLVSANPTLGRVLTDAYYYVNGVPVHLTSFADDPEFPISSSNVFDMLGIDHNEASVYHKDDDLPGNGIIIGECATEEDLEDWAGRADHNTLLAGGSGLFRAVLEITGLKQKKQPAIVPAAPTYPALYVCGSAFKKSKLAVNTLSDKNGPVSFMPIEIILSENPSEQMFDDWACDVIYLLEKYKKAVLAIHENTTKDIPIKAAGLRERTAIVVQKIFEKTPVKELFIEGGSTATAILKKLNIKRCFPVSELAPGVIKMRLAIKDDFFLTLKPGSYDWPVHIWDF